MSEYPFSASPILLTKPTRPGWKWHRLTDLARLATGHTPSRRHPEYWEGDIPWIQLPDIRARDGRVTEDTSEHIGLPGLQNSAAVLLPANTVCLSRTASVGFVTVMGREMATSQDFVNWICGPHLDPQFLMYLLIACRDRIRELGSGAVHHTIYFPTVQSFAVCIPDLVEQRRVVKRLQALLAAAQAAREAAKERVTAAAALSGAYFREVFESTIDSDQFVSLRLGEICQLLPSKSVATNGDTDVMVVTTGCLTERGFLTGGVKRARMRAQDVGQCMLRAGEILVARSNTPELVGRVSMYEGDPVGVVASDLTIRVWPSGAVSGKYITAFLSYLFQTGYWRPRAGGASGTMKKITREQLLNQDIRVPLEPTVADDLASRLWQRVSAADALAAHSQDESRAIAAIPTALLRAFFSGRRSL